MTIERHNKLKALAGASLCVGFSNSSTRDVDLTGELHSPAFEPLADPDYFAQVRVDDEWARFVTRSDPASRYGALSYELPPLCLRHLRAA